MRWFHKITGTPGGDLNALGEALVWYEKEYEEARKELRPQGRITEASLRLPGNSEYYYGIFIELEAIQKWLNIEVEKVTVKWTKHFLENYNRSLNQTTSKDWAEVQPEVADMRQLEIAVGLVRSKFHGINQGLNQLHFQLGNITALHKAGIEDHEL